MRRELQGKGTARLWRGGLVAILVLAAGAVALFGCGGDSSLQAERATAAAKPKRITGKLSESGYTVIALAKSGRAKTVGAPHRSFSLRPPADVVTLHLRAPDGVYAGPIVLGGAKKGRRAIVGVNTGASLGAIKVKPGSGYAKALKGLPKLRRNGWVDMKRFARAKKTLPIGAGNFGRVRSKKTKGGVPGDLDLDGIANPLDIDDDGDLVLDNFERSEKKGRASASADSPGVASGDFGLKTITGGDLVQTVNANAGLTYEQIKPALPGNSFLFINVLPGDLRELDCGRPQSNTDPGLGGLPYCTLGGTGRVNDDDPDSARLPFPDCCDPDRDGFGTLVPDPGHSSPITGFFPGATVDQIGSGDVLIQRVTTDGVETQFVATLQYIFATNPALVSYDDGQGNSAKLSYPVPVGGPGQEDNPLPVKAGPSGDVVVELKFWRPQHLPIPPETGKWIDIGGLNHAATLGEEDSGWATCERGAYSSSDPNLTPITDPGFEAGNASGFTDLSTDRPASPDNTFTYRLNMTECLESKGQSFSAGQTQGFTFAAYAASDPGRGADRTSTLVYFQK